MNKLPKSFLSLVAIFFCLTWHLLSASNDLQGQTVDESNLPEVVKKYSKKATDKWTHDIEKLESKDKAEKHSDDSILFIGSSSIRLWESIETDIAPHHPIQRGYGGAKYTDLANFAERLIHPHKYRAIGMFVANDVQGKSDDTPLEDVNLLVRHIISVSHKHAPEAPVFIIEVTPTRARWKSWEQTRRVNEVLRDICLTTPGTFFIETAEHFIDPKTKQPIEEYFVNDKLHLNADGYALWAKIIKKEFDAHLAAEESTADEK